MKTHDTIDRLAISCALVYGGASALVLALLALGIGYVQLANPGLTLAQSSDIVREASGPIFRSLWAQAFAALAALQLLVAARPWPSRAASRGRRAAAAPNLWAPSSVLR